MTKLGVEISLNKSFTPNKSHPFSCEFAKRKFTENGEISALPLRLLKSLDNEEIRCGMFLKAICDRGAIDINKVDRIPASGLSPEALLLAGALSGDNEQIAKRQRTVLHQFGYVPRPDREELHFIIDEMMIYVFLARP
jgi:hypothetical protein